MKHISIVLPDGQTTLSTISCIVGAIEIFDAANEFWIDNGNSKLYDIELVGMKANSSVGSGLTLSTGNKLIDEVDRTDLVIIPAVDKSFREPLGGNVQLADWIKKQYKNGAEIASMCSGAFLLGSTGIVDGRNCSTHWYFEESFRKQFPKVKLQTEKLITDENGIYTNGGGYSFLNLLIYLVEKYFDRQTAIWCAKMYQIEMDRQSQSPFMIFSGQKHHDDEMVHEAQKYIEEHISDRLTIEKLSEKFNVVRRTFDRRFIKATGNTPVEYIQRVKVEAAKRAFESTRKTVNEVIYELGYADQKVFRDMFKKITGLPPLDYRNKYNIDATLKK